VNSTALTIAGIKLQFITRWLSVEHSLPRLRSVRSLDYDAHAVEDFPRAGRSSHSLRPVCVCTAETARANATCRRAVSDPIKTKFSLLVRRGLTCPMSYNSGFEPPNLTRFCTGPDGINDDFCIFVQHLLARLSGRVNSVTADEFGRCFCEQITITKANFPTIFRPNPSIATSIP
jgi:hypothetical protein